MRDKGETGEMHEPEDFLGLWRVERTIEDRLGLPGRFCGEARFSSGGSALRYREEGTIRLGDGPPMSAHREYLWRWTGNRVEVLFPDGRTFHAFEPCGRAIGTDHPCGRDLYRVIYDFTAWPFWRAEWTVTGPTKDYRLISSFVPARMLAP